MDRQYLLFDIGEIQYAVSMEYVEYILAAEGEYLSFELPKMPFYINRVMYIEKKTVAVIELENLGKDNVVYGGIRPLVLILKCRGDIIGLQVDKISLLPVHSEPALIKDNMNQCAILQCSEGEFVLLDVPEMLGEIGTENEK